MEKQEYQLAFLMPSAQREQYNLTSSSVNLFQLNHTICEISASKTLSVKHKSQILKLKYVLNG